MIGRKIGLWLAIGTFLSCNTAKFSGDSRQRIEEPPQPPPQPPPAPEQTPITTNPDEQPVEPPQCDMTNDFIRMKFPQEIQGCMDGARLYDFYRKRCSPVAKATTFECSFAGLKAKVGQMNLDSRSIDRAINEGAKLIGCGEKRGGLTVVAEWWQPSSQGSEGDCSFVPGTVITVTCFQNENGDGTVVDAPTPEAKKEILRKCLD